MAQWGSPARPSVEHLGSSVSTRSYLDDDTDDNETVRRT